MYINKIVIILSILVLLAIFSQAQSDQEFAKVKNLTPEIGKDDGIFIYYIYFLSKENPVEIGDDITLSWYKTDDTWGSNPIAENISKFNKNPMKITMTIDQKNYDLFIGKIYARIYNDLYLANHNEGYAIRSPMINRTIRTETVDNKIYKLYFKSIENYSISVYGIIKIYNFDWYKISSAKIHRADLERYLEDLGVTDPTFSNKENFIEITSHGKKYRLVRNEREEKATLFKDNDNVEMGNLTADFDTGQYVQSELLGRLRYDPSQGWLNKTFNAEKYTDTVLELNPSVRSS
jgi:hypothetical protein